MALHVSAYSLKALVEAFRPLLVAAGADGRPGASVVGLDFDATRGLARLRLDGGVQGGARVPRRATWHGTSDPSGSG